MNSKYEMEINTLTPNIKPGDSIEIELFLRGYGNTPQHKIFITYPKYLINETDPGHISHCIGVEVDPQGNVVGPVTGEPYLSKAGEKTRQLLTIEGTYYILNTGYYMENPSDDKIGDIGLPRLLGEMRHNKIPPILIKINTSSSVPSGNYEVKISLIYVDEKEVNIDIKSSNIHIKSYGELHSKKISIVGLILSLPLLENILSILYEGWKGILTSLYTLFFN